MPTSVTPSTFLKRSDLTDRSTNPKLRMSSDRFGSLTTEAHPSPFLQPAYLIFFPNNVLVTMPWFIIFICFITIKTSWDRFHIGAHYLGQPESMFLGSRKVSLKDFEVRAMLCVDRIMQCWTLHHQMPEHPAKIWSHLHERYQARTAHISLSKHRAMSF